MLNQRQLGCLRSHSCFLVPAGTPATHILCFVFTWVVCEDLGNDHSTATALKTVRISNSGFWLPKQNHDDAGLHTLRMSYGTPQEGLQEVTLHDLSRTSLPRNLHMLTDELPRASNRPRVMQFIVFGAPCLWPTLLAGSAIVESA